MSTRERPKLLFDASGNPTHLLNGICPTPHCPPQVRTRATQRDYSRSLGCPISSSTDFLVQSWASTVVFLFDLQAAIQCKVQGLGPHEGYWDRTLVTPLVFN
jgi:hypothetical protein